MTTDIKGLTKAWIQYLKNNQIVNTQSDPQTGRLIYKRKVTTDDVAKFLEVKTDFDNQTISNAIHIVLSRKVMGAAPEKVSNKPSEKKPGTNLSTWHHNEITPSEKQHQSTQHVVDLGPPKLSHDRDSISDIDYKEVSDEPNERQKFKRRSVREALVDNEGYILSEDDVEMIFTILLGDNVSVNKKTDQSASNDARINSLNRLKMLIRNNMSDSQRRSLWRALKNA